MPRLASLLKDGRYRWPVYDVEAYFRNLESTRLYARNREKLNPTDVERRVIDDLRRDGLSIIQFSDLFPESAFRAIQAWGEALLAQPAINESIKTIEGGGRPADAKAGKFYIVRPLGDPPTFDVNDGVITMSLSDSVLRIVAGYLGSLGRFAGAHLWVNVPTSGPDIASQRWHRDPEDRRIVKTFLYLRDVTPGSGPFSFVVGSHNRGPFKHVFPQVVRGNNYPETGFVEETFAADKRRSCTGKAGSLVFCDTTGFHKGGHATEVSRFVFNGIYTTNAGPSTRARQYFLTGSRPAGMSPEARYALGHLEALNGGGAAGHSQPGM